jgi:hypothetical protein
VAAGARDRTLEVGDRLTAGMAHLFELLLGELRLERQDETGRGLARGVRHDVKLNRHDSRLIGS